MNLVYRAYRIPYNWIPQMDKPQEKAIPRIDNNQFRVPGSLTKDPIKKTKIVGAKELDTDIEFCIVPETEDKTE